MYVNESHMPGPSEEAKALQLKQRAARNTLYQTLNDVRSENPALSNQDAHQHPRSVEARQAYEDTVNQLVSLLGAEVHCGNVDVDLWDHFSDWYKDEYGMRPRSTHFTLTEVLKRFESLQAA